VQDPTVPLYDAHVIHTNVPFVAALHTTRHGIRLAADRIVDALVACWTANVTTALRIGFAAYPFATALVSRWAYYWTTVWSN